MLRTSENSVQAKVAELGTGEGPKVRAKKKGGVVMESRPMYVPRPNMAPGRPRRQCK
jgi:hypothetical protein